MSFRIAPIFCIRPTGVPFDVLSHLGTPDISQAARAFAAVELDVATAARDALRQLAATRDAPPKLATRIGQHLEIGAGHLATYPWLAPYHRAVSARAAGAAELEEQIATAYKGIHDVLLVDAARVLPDFLVIESESLAEDLERRATREATDTHLSKDRKSDRALALYVQRVCAKNDTVSRFGPIAWGKVVDGEGVVMRPEPGIARRRVELERWVVKGLLALINADPDTRSEVTPRVHPYGRFEPTGFVRLDEGRDIELTAEETAIARRCDGATSAHRIGASEVLATLADRGVIRWELEPMAIDVSPFASLLADVATWRAGPVRERWEARLAPLANLVERFASDVSAETRRGAVADVRTHLASIGLGERERNRVLYTARNPINENCQQAGTFTIGAHTANALVSDAAPWFELFRDAAALAGVRAFERLHPVIASAPRRAGKLSYAALIGHAHRHGLTIHNEQWHTQIGGEVFAEIKRGFREVLGGRPDAAEWQLTADDCLFLRRQHRLPQWPLTVPSVDLQVSARSVEDAAAGRLRWIVAELHFALVLLQHGIYWSCPDKPAFHAQLEQLEPGAYLANDTYSEAPVHTCGEARMSALPRTRFLGANRPKPGWPVVRPADAEVVVDEEHCDVRLRAPSGEDLGSIIRTVRLVSGLHPFFPFERPPHQPRLCLGEVVVQRRTWAVDSSAIGEPRPAGVSAAFICGIERERAARDIPRWVFARPAPGTLKSAWSSRDKDNKPFYLDLESVVFLDIFERRLNKYGTLMLTEMIPDPRELVWVLPDGRYTFEVRANLVTEEDA